MALKNCHECQAEISDKAASCPRCGVPFNPGYPASAVPVKDKSVAVILAIFLGGLGLHKFYLNRPGWGVLYILFCWTFVPAILGILEGICYLSESQESFQKRYGRA